MSKKLYFPKVIVLILFLATIGICGNARVDFDDREDPNAKGPSTEPGYTGFLISDSGSEVNGIIIDLSGDIDDRRRATPTSDWSIPNLGWPVIAEQIHRDFIFGNGANESVNIDLWGLGAGQKCDIHIWAFDDGSHSLRIANWTANGAYLLTTEFIGGDPFLWPVEFIHGPYDFNGIGYADEDGHIYLTSERDPNSDEGEPFCFVNALEVYPIGTPNDVNKAHRLVPLDGAEDVPIDTELSWRPGDAAVVFDVYFGTDPCSPAFLGTVGSNSIDPYGASGFLAMGKTYFWRVDANDGAGNVYTGEVASFTTSNNYMVDDFEAYGWVGLEIRDHWDDYWVNGTGAEVYRQPYPPALDEQSMEYQFLNHYSPYYSEATLDLTQSGVEIDTNFVGIDVQSLSIWFYGQSGNPVTEQMYAILSDGDNETAHVNYSGDMSDITEHKWHEWNISMQAFLDANSSLDLSDIEVIGIGFAVGAHVDGTVYFDDIRLYTSRCVLSELSADFDKVDYAPINNNDCKVDYQEIRIMSNEWLIDTYGSPPNNPGTNGLVAYYPFDDFNDANSVPDLNLPDGVIVTRNMAPAPHPNAVWAILSPIDPCDSNEGPVTIISPGVIIDNRPDGNCVHFEADGSELGERIHCGRWPVVGNFEPGEPDDDGWYKGTGDLTLSIWAKWTGPHITRAKSQGMISKRINWSDDGLIWMFECDTIPSPRGSFSLQQFRDEYSLFSPAGIMDLYIGQWIHLAATYHGTIEPDVNTARLYLNGAEVASGPFYFSGGDPNGITMTIGNNADIEQYWGVENYLGELDEASIFNRALEPDEIAYLADRNHNDPWPILPLTPYSDVFPGGPPWTVNFKDFAVVANYWLFEEIWPPFQATESEAECFPSNHPDYANWITAGRPTCWCCPTQCHGDANCDGVVDDSDSNPIEPLIGEAYPSPNYNPCLDFDHDLMISTSDVEIIRLYYLRSPPGDCLW